MQANRGSFVATPTAELSNQEEALLDNILDWSLDTSCSGYEGDMEEESEGEKENSSMVAVSLVPLPDAENKQAHCRALSSDDDSFCEAEKEVKEDHPCAKLTSTFADLHSSGYSSVQSISPSSTCSSSLIPYTLKSFSTASAQPGFRLLVPMQRPRGTSSKPVKRKNVAAHSGGEVVEREEDLAAAEYSTNGGFLSQ